MCTYFCKQSAMLIVLQNSAHISKTISNGRLLQNMCTYFQNNQQCWLNTKYVHIFFKQSAMLIEHKICAHIIKQSAMEEYKMISHILKQSAMEDYKIVRIF